MARAKKYGQDDLAALHKLGCYAEILPERSFDSDEEEQTVAVAPPVAALHRPSTPSDTSTIEETGSTAIQATTIPYPGPNAASTADPPPIQQTIINNYYIVDQSSVNYLANFDNRSS
jgi:hypothetical protein